MLAFGFFVPAARVQPRPVPAFRHVIVVVFENKDRSEVLGNDAAPTFNVLAGRYATLGSYRAVAHPSLPNYLALVSGSTYGLTETCTACVFSGPSLADTLPRAHKTWKTYAEDLPWPGYTGASADGYAKKHNPFLYFRTVLKSPARRARVVPLTQFSRDLARRRLPSFSLVVPNLCNSMHDCSVATGDAWLRDFVTPLLKTSELRGSVVFVIFDEGTTDDGGGGDVAASCYGEDPAPEAYGVNVARDTWELALVGAARAAGLPILGLCRGVQVLNVAAGGTLIQHLPVGTDESHKQYERDCETVHPVEVDPGSLLATITGPREFGVNTLHHQAVADVGAGLRPVAWAPDGVIEAVESVDGRPLLGVQWHPELLTHQPPHDRLFAWLVQAAGDRRAATRVA